MRATDTAAEGLLEIEPIGSGAWQYAYVAVSQGVHQFHGDAPFGLRVYGFNDAVSYGHPGGMKAADE